MRRSFQFLAAAALTALAAVPAMAKECAVPGQAPTVPDGTTATADQMKAAHDGVQSYVNTLQDYQDCLESNIKNAPKGTKGEDLQRLRDKGNAAIAQAEALKNDYVAQVKAYKARQPK
jgi:hypothetical protein